MRLRVLVLLAIAPMFAVGQTASRPPLFTAQSSVTIVPLGHGLLTPRTDNVRFTASGTGPWQVYEERFVTQETDGNCCYTDITVTAYDLTRSGRQTRRWTIRAPGETGELYDSFYKISLGGCCGDSDTHTYYRVDLGRKLYRSIQPLLKIRVGYHNDLDRYIAILNERTPDPHQTLKPGMSSLDYGSATRIQERLLIRFGDHELRGARLVGGHDEESEYERSVNWDRAPASPALLSGIGIELEFWENIKVTLPVENDRIQFDTVTLPEGMTIERQPVR